MNEKGQKSKIVNALVIGKPYKGISKKEGKNYGKPQVKPADIVGYIMQTHDGKKAIMTKLEAFNYVEFECDGEILNAEMNVKKTASGFSPYLQGNKEFGSLRQIEKRIDREVFDEKGEPVFETLRNGEKRQKTEIMPEFREKFGKVPAKKGKKAGKNPVADAEKKAKKRAAIREYLAKQKGQTAPAPKPAPAQKPAPAPKPAQK